MRNAKIVAAVASLAIAAGLGAVSLAVGCSSSSSGEATGGGSGDGGSLEACIPIDSACGEPCDPGNSLGIGKFCNTISDCHGSAIPTVCATLGDPHEHFCTALCSPPDASDDSGFPKDCGEGASCQCQGQCGCFPNACF